MKHFVRSLAIILPFGDSQDAVSNIVTVLDYAGATDTIAGAIFLIIWMRNKEHSDRRLTLAAILTTILAGFLWWADAGYSHRLSFLQQEQNEHEKEAIRKNLKTAEIQRDQAQEAAKAAEAASKNASAQAEKLGAASAKVAELDAKTQDRTISQEQIDRFTTFLINSPKAPIWVVSDDPLRESQALSHTIRRMLDNAGYGVGNVPFPSPDRAMLVGAFGGGTGGASGLYTLLASGNFGLNSESIGAVVIGAEDVTSPPLQALALSHAFGVAGIKMEARARPNIKQGQVVVLIQGKR